ncbi:Rod binding protein [Jannaschia faecimaris]|uniref:Rod binding protein n=1 Tax=Jannaschia faecimaris TaxID=1244108 RepID=A0A1H3Q0Y9_9RHOB|nr:rod-binding protein [Jannaschia faecimaris]SDZ06389.1 Rod binding protein [Jannaschia faecimaris]
MEAITSTLGRTPPPLKGDPTDTLRTQAQALEAFLFAEMLRVSGTGAPSPTGGTESQFDSFLRQAQADSVAASGQTGLAEAIYRSMLSRAGFSGS